MLATNALETVQSCLDRIEQYDDKLRAFITVLNESVLKEAGRADDAARQGQWLGPLHGMPIALKDNIDTAGVRTTRGATAWSQHIPEVDAVVVQRLKQAGAMIIGKTALGELVFDIRSHNPIVGELRNPWDLERSPGGSSGGSAAAVAANMTVAALGSDTGGSIRLPAAHSGVCGLRPTHGVVPSTGASAVSYQNDTIGPMARSVVDVAKIFAVIAGWDDEDPYSVAHTYPDLLSTLNRGVEGLRIGIPTHFYFDGLSPDIETAVMEVARTLESHGAQLVDVELTDAERTHEQASVLIYGDVAVYNDELLQRQDMTAPMYARMRRGLDYSAIDYAEATMFKQRWKRTLRRAFEGVDLILTPTTPVEALPNSDTADLHSLTARAAQYTYGGSLGGIPGMSIPCGLTSHGLPIGALLQAGWFQEALIFRAGHVYQQHSDWHRRVPALLTS